MTMCARRIRAPRALLICCEGKTEEAYFNALLDFFRLPAFVQVEVYGQRGQHLALIDNAVALRSHMASEICCDMGEVECWAVCDEDQMPCTYVELCQYAEDHDVRLAFSAPQFEMYLLQHFEQSSLTDRDGTYQRLSEYRGQFGGVGAYCDRTKSDLAWIAVAIDKTPKIVSVAITNSDQRNRPTKRPFFTVQKLAKRILDLSI